jgi:AcrR family transcriptional regulator
MARTQQERKAETRARLLAAAADLFADQGIAAVSVDAVAEAAGRTSGAVYAHFGSKQGLLLALLDSWKDSLLAVLLAEVAVSDSPAGQLAAVWSNVSDSTDVGAARWPVLEQELWLRAARDPEVADILRVRNAEALRFSARQLEGWTSAVGARPTASPEELAVLVKALLTGLALQKRLAPATVPDDLALRGIAALVGLPPDQIASPADRPTTAGSRRPGD